MKSFKKFFSVLLCLCLSIVLAFSCLACAPTENPDDTGTPGGPGGPGQQTCNHDDKIFCDECDKMVLGDEFFVNYVKSGWNTLGNGKALKYEIKDVEFELIPPADDADGFYEIPYQTEDGYDTISVDKYSGTLSNTYAVMGFDADSNIYIDASLTLVLNAYVDDAIFAKQEQTVAVSIKENAITNSIAREMTFPGLSSALQELNNREEENSFTDVFDQSEVMPEEITYVFSALQQDVIPMLTDIVDSNKESINNSLAEVFDSTFTVKKVGDNYKFTNKDVGPTVKKLDEILNGTVSEAVDMILGEGTYAKLPQIIDDVLGMTLQELVQEVEKSGKSLEEIIDMLNDFIQAYLAPDAPEYGDVTIDNLLFPEGDMSILQFVQENKDKTVKDFIIEFAGIEESEFEQFIQEEKAFIAEVADMKIAEDLLEIDGQAKTVISSVINDVSELIDDVIKMELVLDKNGNVVSCAANLSIDSTNENFVGILDALNANLDVEFSGSLTMELTSVNIPA